MNSFINTIKNNPTIVVIVIVLVGLGALRLLANRGGSIADLGNSTDSVAQTETAVGNTDAGATPSDESGKTGKEGELAAVGDKLFFAKDPTITVKDQTAGYKVEVASISIGQDLWLVVHDDQNGAPGKIMGAQRFRTEQKPASGAVDLLRNTVAGGKYYAVFHMDDGDATFDATKDLLYKTEKGDMVTASFMATASAAVK